MTYWTTARTDTLRGLWNSNSSSIIAEKLGCTRNAVIGKAHRLNLPVKNLSAIGVGARGSRLISLPFRRPARKPRDVVVIPDAMPSRNLSIVEIKPGECRWATGSSTAWSHLFCGAPVESGSFCAHHTQLCYAPLKRAA